MTLDELNRLISHPEELNRSTLLPLADLVQTYPYAQGLVMLYLLNLSIIGDLRYDAELQRWAPHLPSREKLYLLSQLHMPLDDLTPLVAQDSSDSFALVDQYLRQVAEREGPLSSELEYDTAGVVPGEGPVADYFSAEEYQSTASESPLTAFAPIPESPASSEQLPTRATRDATSEASDGEMPSDTLFTETLAAIYIKQGHYERAKQILQGLSLKFPEKFSYFAVQLDFLEKLIDNASRT